MKNKLLTLLTLGCAVLSLTGNVFASNERAKTTDVFLPITSIDHDIKSLEEAAKKYDPVSMRKLGILYMLGSEVEKDIMRGLSLLRKAAVQKDKLSYAYLCAGYTLSPADNKDFKKGLKWCEKAAAFGDAMAVLLAASIHETGKLVIKNTEKARYFRSVFLDRALTKVHIDKSRRVLQVLISMASPYLNNQKNMPTFSEIINGVMPSAQTGDVVAQNILGYAYSFSSDEVKAYEWFLKSAEQGDRYGQFNIGLSHYKAKEYKEAAVWFEKASENCMLQQRWH